MNTTITLQQLNTALIFLIPFLVALLAGLLRQDGLSATHYAWINELLLHVVLLGLAFLQTFLGGDFGGSSVTNFLFAVAISYGVLNTEFGKSLLQSVQTATSVFKAPPPAPPAPPQLSIDADKLAALILARMNAVPQPIEQQPTQQIQAVKTNTPPIGA